MSRIIIPEYNTVRTCLTVAFIFIIIAIIAWIVLGLVQAGLMTLMAFSGPGFMGGAILATFVLIIYFVIAAFLGFIAFKVSHIKSDLEKAVNNRDIEMIEEVRKRMLIWGIISLILGFVIPGIALLYAYHKAEKITEKVQQKARQDRPDEEAQ